jgi:hypothetical protein
MRISYFGGAPGVLASALAWFAAGMVAHNNSPKIAVLVLFIGGMFIFPVSVLFTKVLGRSGVHAPENKLGTLTLEGTFQLILCLPLAYVVSLYRLGWFFPAMLLVIGGRYLTFSTLYGSRWYWACGITLALAGFLLVMINASPSTGAFTGALIETVFSVLIFFAVRREPSA